MPPVIIANCVELQVLWQLNSQNCENRVYVRVTPPITAPLMADLIDVAGQWVTDHYAPVCSDSVLFSGFIATDKSVDGGLQLQVPFAVNGSATGAVLPNEVSVAVKLTTGFSGRSKRGRWYMPPPTLAQLADSNHISGATATAYRTALQHLIDDLAASDYRVGVVSLQHNNAPVVSPVVLGYTVAVLTDNLLDSMKTRKPGVGT